MGYKYKELDYENVGEGSSATIGKVYRVKEDDLRSRLFKGDLLLCLFKSGDCHYDYVRVSHRCGNGYDEYFTLHEAHTGYGGTFEDAFPSMRPFNASDLVHVLHKGECLITARHCKTDEELELIDRKGEIEEELREIQMEECKTW